MMTFRPSHPERRLMARLSELTLALKYASDGICTADNLRVAAELIRSMGLPSLTSTERDRLTDLLIFAQASVGEHLPMELADEIRRGMTALTGLVLCSSWPAEMQRAEHEKINAWRGWSKHFRNAMENIAIRDDLADRGFA